MQAAQPNKQGVGELERFGWIHIICFETSLARLQKWTAGRGEPEDHGTRDHRNTGPEDRKGRSEDQGTRGLGDHRTRGPQDQGTTGPEPPSMEPSIPCRGPRGQGAKGGGYEPHL